MKEKIFSTALAGLLHDVGKLLQRSKDDPWRAYGGTEFEGQPVHATWSMDFIQRCVPQKFRSAALPGAYHHHPERIPSESQHLAALIALADKLSAGERADLEEGQKKGKHPEQLVTIFDRLSLDGHKPEPAHYYPLGTLKLEHDLVFPQTTRVQDIPAAYRSLVEDLEREAKGAIDDPQTYLENLLYAFQRTTWCVPSAYYHSVPDVSLYDHSRMTAALAVCLAESSLEDIQKITAAVQRQFIEKPQAEDAALLAQPAALLVGGDISGIQDFIYSISSKKAARTLRGRSFYLQLLTEAVLRNILQHLGLPYTNVIYSGGGHFYLLAPTSAAGQLAGIQHKISQAMLKAHGVHLYLALTWEEVPFSGFRRGHFPEHWNKMHARLGKVKQRRYQELGQDFYNAVFEPQPHLGNQEDHCAVCGRDTAGTRLIGEDSEEARICPMCASFEAEIGKLLPQSRYLLMSFGEAVPLPEHFTAMDVLAAFGMKVEFIASSKEQLSIAGGERGVLWALEETGDIWPVVPDLPVARTTHYAVHQVPEGSFEDLVKKARGIPRLGVLRMDVDHLGQLFKHGFGSDPETSLATLARLATLSFQMSLFFEGWLQQIVSSKAGDVYTVYAGGDDLFLIAPWDQVPDLALQIVDDFAAYTAANPDLHLSGGMTFIHGKYPVYQAAEDAGEAEKMAKNSGRNAFTFLERPWKWEQFSSIKEKYERLLHIDNFGSAHSLLQILQRLSNMETETRKKNQKLVWGPWMWMADYQLKRMSDRSKSNSDLHPLLEQLRSDVHDDLWQHQDMQQWGTAARWAQLALRNDEKRSR